VVKPIGIRNHKAFPARHRKDGSLLAEIDFTMALFIANLAFSRNLIAMLNWVSCWHPSSPWLAALVPIPRRTAACGRK